ncbi:hypothetical protein IVG45_21070 [Methylomonas sp. LL1]|nr:hypothetical protein [Methylomonas sp. LL1]QPK63265.1 hypothetical protein IVG45_21070 [Methylomonas sp. LL1]
MMRMLLEIVMVLAIVGGLIFVMKVLAREKQPDKDTGDDEGGSTSED